MYKTDTFYYNSPEKNGGKLRYWNRLDLLFIKICSQFCKLWC